MTTFAYLGRYDAQVFAGVDPTTIGKSLWTLQTVTYPGGGSPHVTYSYQSAGLPYALTGVSDERDVQIASWTYGSGGRVVAASGAGGADASGFSYNDAANQVTVTNPLSKAAIYQFSVDTQGQRHLAAINGQASAHCPASNSTFGYDGNSFLSDVTDGAGRVRHQVNDSRGRATLIVEGYGSPVARTTTITWNSAFSVPDQIVEPGRTTSLTYDAAGRVLTRTETDTTSQSVPYATNGRTRSWGYGYTAQGQLATVDGPRSDVSDVSHYAYTADGYLQSVTDALGHVTTVTAVDGAGRPLSVTDANGAVTALAYDARGRLASVTRSGGAVTGLSYDLSGLLTGVTLPDGASLTYSYDAARRLTGIADGTGGAIAYSLDTMGNPTQIQVTASGNTLVRSQTRAYDELGRLLARMSSASQNGAVRSYPTTPPGRGRPHCRPHPLGSSEAGAHPS